MMYAKFITSVFQKVSYNEFYVTNDHEKDSDEMMQSHQHIPCKVLHCDAALFLFSAVVTIRHECSFFQSMLVKKVIKQANNCIARVVHLLDEVK